MSSKVLVLSAHPDVLKSRAAGPMFEAAKSLPNVKVIDIYETQIEAEAYADAIKEADVLVFQFPMWWEAHRRGSKNGSTS